MHPLAHMLTGALIGQVVPTSGGAFLGGVVSHFVLDVIPHTEGKTFRTQPGDRRPGLDLLEAGAEAIVGSILLAWMIRSCPGVHAPSVGVGAFAALLPDLIDFPLKQLFNVTVIHVPRLHWTVGRRHAIWGILTQVAVIVAAASYLWRVTRCG